MKTITKLIIINGLIFFVLLGHSKLMPSNDALEDLDFPRYRNVSSPLTAINPNISLQVDFSQPISQAVLLRDTKPVCSFSAVKHSNLVPSYFKVGALESYTERNQLGLPECGPKDMTQLYTLLKQRFC